MYYEQLKIHSNDLMEEIVTKYDYDCRNMTVNDSASMLTIKYGL